MKSLRMRDVSLIILICVFFLQALRNLSSLVYTGILVLSFLFAFFTNCKRITGFKSVIFTLFLILYALLPVISLFQMPLNEYITALVRYGGGAMMVVILVCCRDNLYHNTARILKAFVVIVMIASLLIIYQVLFGKIAFFDFSETNGRLGHERYGSLLGASTVFSTMAPIVVLIVNHFRHQYKMIVRLFIQAVIIVAGFFSLSKAFIANIAIVYFFVFIFDYPFRKSLLSILKNAFPLVLAIIVLLFGIVPNTKFGVYLTEMLEYSFSGNNNILNDLFTRMTELPKAAFEYHNFNIVNATFGIGFKGYAGVLGLYDYPMCHNNYADIILSQGIFSFILFVLMYLKMFRNAMKKNTPMNRLTMTLIIYIFINMLVGQFNYLHIFSMIFLSLIVSNYEMKLRKRRIVKKGETSTTKPVECECA